MQIDNSTSDAFVRWLNDEGECSESLIVLDDVYYADDRVTKLVNELSQLPNGSVRALLSTTRDRDVALRFTSPANHITLPALNASELKGLLRSNLASNLAPDPIREDDVAILVQQLAGNPLVILQAAVFVLSRNMMPNVLELFLDPEIRGRILDTTADMIKPSISARIAVTRQSIRQRNTRADELLSLMAVFGKAPIVEDLLRARDEDDLDFQKAMGILHALFTISTCERNRIMHPIVQEVIMRQLAARELHTFQVLALERLLQQYPEEPSEHSESLFDHAQTVTSYVFDEWRLQLERANLLQRMIKHAFKHDLFAVLLQMCSDSYEIRKGILGFEGLITLESGSSLAKVLQVQGRYEEASDLLEQTLLATERLVGPKHSLYVRTLRFKADLWRDLTEYKIDPKTSGESLALCQRVVDLSEETLGQEHPETIWAQSELAYMYYLQREVNLASDLSAQALRRTVETLGREHFLTRAITRDIAQIELTLGNTTKSIILLEEALTQSDNLPGELHKLTILGDLAHIRQARKEFQTAQQLYREAIDIARDKKLGDIPAVLRVAARCALFILQLGYSVEATAIHQEVVTHWGGLFGTTHPTTIAYVEELGKLYSPELVSFYNSAYGSVQATRSGRESKLSTSKLEASSDPEKRPPLMHISAQQRSG